MTKYELTIRTIEDRGLMTVAELHAATGIPVITLRGYLGSAKARGYVQSVREPKQPARYACTSLEYETKRNTYRRPIVWHGSDGTDWVLPSVNAVATIRNVSNGHPWACVLNGWRFFGDYLEFLES